MSKGSTHGFARKRDRNEQEIVDALESIGCSVQRLSERGVPDLLVAWRPPKRAVEVLKLIEVKTPDGKPTSAQVEWRTRWRGDYHVAVTVEYALRTMGVTIRSTMPGMWFFCSSGKCDGDDDTCEYATSHHVGTYKRPKSTETTKKRKR